MYTRRGGAGYKEICLFHLVSIRVGTHSLSSHTRYDIDITAVVLKALLGADSWLFLLFFSLFYLGGLSLDFTGTCQRSVNFSPCV